MQRSSNRLSNESHNLENRWGTWEILGLKLRWYNLNRFIAKQRILADTVTVRQISKILFIATCSELLILRSFWISVKVLLYFSDVRYNCQQTNRWRIGNFENILLKWHLTKFFEISVHIDFCRLNCLKMFQLNTLCIKIT